MLPHLSAILCPLAAPIRHPPHHLVFPAELCGPENDLAQKKRASSSHVAPLYFFFSSRCCTFSLLSEERGSCRLSTQKHKAAIFRCQAQTCDSNLCCGGATAAPFVAKRKRIALKIGPTTQKKSSGICAFIVDYYYLPFPMPDLLLSILMCCLVALYISV